jgi:hypothetical protein
MFSSLTKVYAFYYNGNAIGAVSVKESERKFWISQTISQEMKDVIAAAAVILTVRQNLYK